MGEVFEAVDEESGEAVAIKVLGPALANTEGFRDRFEAEIESLRILRHPNIVQLFGYGEQNGFLFYSMELVRGRSLEDELNAGRRFNWREVANIGIKLSKALKHAHDHGVIHRDLKPANILITFDEEIKLLDFGIARLFGGTHQTSHGGVLGTAEYMSPEQADGSPITDRCDQYSLGGVLYALAAGRPPFQAEALPELLQLQRYAEPEPVTRFAPDLPEQFAAIIMQLLEKDPEKRFSNMSILSRHLAAVVQALSRPLDDDDFKISAVTPAAPSVDADELQPTRVPHERGVAMGQTSPSGPATADIDDPVIEVVDDREEIRRNRFTTVAEQDRLAREREHESWAIIAARLGSLLAALLLLLWIGWYLLRPPSADDLYGEIDAAANTGSAENLLEVEEAIDEFVLRFPQDDRRDEVVELQQEVELMRTERRLRARARRLGGREGLAPIERMYVESIALEELNPDRALAALAALIDLYDDPDEGHSLVQQRVIELAGRQIARLERRTSQHRPDLLSDLKSRIARADELAESRPGQARKMLEAIVVLCQDKPWAAEVTSQAKERLQALNGRVAENED
jgi:serine/threonine-protein kinase